MQRQIINEVVPIHAQDPAPILQVCGFQTKAKDFGNKWLRLSVLWSRLALFVSELYSRQYSKVETTKAN